ncbi:histidine-containing phosphotransfer protein 1 isoform X1 [Ricinus communis]|uniref:histidine-containing phosphotransfer protein 1 isoform X1 n=1 Tax=Ricinus communis TaxID=3988 RepID=UPI00201A26EE|nr:histidine-containing phosphotransfer protein 1 isoform X1 [Ricinus communis]
MVGIDLMHQQRLFVRNLKQQGILDNHFDQVLEIRTVDNPRFVLEVISMFLNDADNCVSELNRLLNEAVVDYTQVVNYCHQLRGSSASIGARLVAVASRELRLATDEMDQHRCLVAFDKLKDEYQNLKNNFNIITQIERTIVANHTRRRNVRP